MASQSTPRVPNSQANVTLFGRHIAESITQKSPQFSRNEVGYYYDLSLRSPPQLEQDCLSLLNTGNEFFQRGRENIHRILRLWGDAMTAKELYDASGIYSNDMQYMRSLLLCVNLFADRFSLGYNQASEIQRYRGYLQSSTAPPPILMRNDNKAALLPSMPLSRPQQVRAPAIPRSLAGRTDVSYLPLQGGASIRIPEADTHSHHLMAASDGHTSGETTEEDCQSLGDYQSSIDSSDDTDDDTASTVEVRPLPSNGLWATRVLPEQATSRIVPSTNKKRTFTAMAEGGSDIPAAKAA